MVAVDSEVEAEQERVVELAWVVAVEQELVLVVEVEWVGAVVSEEQEQEPVVGLAAAGLGEEPV